jgi:hypothetical protein
MDNLAAILEEEEEEEDADTKTGMTSPSENLEGDQESVKV